MNNRNILRTFRLELSKLELPMPAGSSAIKAGVYMNRSEIWSIIKREFFGLKWVGNTTRKLTTPSESPKLLGDCLVSIYSFFTSNFNFSSKSIKCLIFHIFLNLTYSLRKKISFPKCPRITQKFTQNRQTVVMRISRKI